MNKEQFRSYVHEEMENLIEVDDLLFKYLTGNLGDCIAIFSDDEGELYSDFISQSAGSIRNEAIAIVECEGISNLDLSQFYDEDEEQLDGTGCVVPPWTPTEIVEHALENFEYPEIHEELFKKLKASFHERVIQKNVEGYSHE